MYHRSSQRPSYHRRSQNPRKIARKPQGIDVSLFVKKAKPQVAITQPEVSIKFTELPLTGTIQRAIERRGFEHPTPIQAKAIPYVLQGKDVIGIANTGTGKTGAFVLPLLQKILVKPNERILILVPTRELGQQIKDEIFQFAYGMNIYSTLCIGGASIQNQIYQLRRNPHFIIATPGRLKDLIKRNILHLDTIHTVILDEADRMVDMGFIHDITEILALLPTQRQSLFFSATMPPAVTGIVQRFLHNPVTISVSTQRTSENVDQDIVRVTEGKDKIAVLEELLKQEQFSRVIIFGRTKWGVERLSRHLSNRGFKATSIHGDKQQRQREQAISLFKKQIFNILVATDVAARGIDIPDVSHVINFDQPATYEDYIHRIGRTGRGNKKGTALTFV